MTRIVVGQYPVSCKRPQHTLRSTHPCFIWLRLSTDFLFEVRSATFTMLGKVAVFVGFFAVLALVEVQGERLVWTDEFDILNTTTWSHEVTGWDGGNGELQYYRNNRKNSFVKDGVLYIRPTETVEDIPDLEHGKINETGCTKEPCVIQGGWDILPPYFSARMLSKTGYTVKYGRVEFRAKMPVGDWLTAAVWMYPKDEKYGGWPTSGEIDIAGVRGNPNYTDEQGNRHGNNEVGTTLNFGPAWNNKASLGATTESPAGKLWSDDFHVYEFIWNKDYMKFLIDGKVTYQVTIPAGGFTELGHLNPDVYKGYDKNAPFDQEFFFVLNVAVGGAAFPDGWKSGGRNKPWKGGDNRRQLWQSSGFWEKTWGTPDQHSMQIDYIRVYQD